MKKYPVLFGFLFILVGFESCSKNADSATYSKFPYPNWAVDSSGKFPVSMTAVVSLPEDMRSSLQSDDKLGAFVNDSCRGLGVIVNVNNTPVYYVLIHGTASEQSKIIFRYYSTKTSYMYQTADAFKFTVDENYGTADLPQVLDLQQIK